MYEVYLYLVAFDIPPTPFLFNILEVDHDIFVVVCAYTQPIILPVQIFLTPFFCTKEFIGHS